MNKIVAVCALLSSIGLYGMQEDQQDIDGALMPEELGRAVARERLEQRGIDQQVEKCTFEKPKEVRFFCKKKTATDSINDPLIQLVFERLTAVLNTSMNVKYHVGTEGIMSVDMYPLCRHDKVRGKLTEKAFQQIKKDFLKAGFEGVWNDQFFLTEQDHDDAKESERDDAKED